MFPHSLHLPAQSPPFSGFTIGVPLLPSLHSPESPTSPAARGAFRDAIANEHAESSMLEGAAVDGRRDGEDY